MGNKSIYRTPDAERRLGELTRAFRDRLDTAFMEHDIPTPFGRTRVVEGGRLDGPPLVVLHGGGTNSYYALYFLKPLLARFHVFGVDMPGHPGGSEQVFIDPRGDDFGHWLVDVVDALGLAPSACLGVSWGGLAVQRFAAVAPRRITKAVLVVPAGIVNPPLLPMVRAVLVPKLLCRLTNNPRFLEHTIRRVFTDCDDPLVREFALALLRDLIVDTRPMKRSTPEEMRGFAAPKLIVGADQDVCFPGPRMEARCRAVFPEPYTFHMLRQSKHCPSMKEDSLARLCELIAAFLESDG
ncbi:MAG: alpha/beta fold hydrolase [Candidatus Hydrogenedentes bacterium]|nr:alpha/beta fold hydrolase [Candidatus Hydrogenedentota bacterium]